MGASDLPFSKAALAAVEHETYIYSKDRVEEDDSRNIGGTFHE
jgi:hypothetical protein